MFEVSSSSSLSAPPALLPLPLLHCCLTLDHRTLSRSWQLLLVVLMATTPSTMRSLLDEWALAPDADACVPPTEQVDVCASTFKSYFKFLDVTAASVYEGIFVPHSDVRGKSWHFEIQERLGW
jgi:hypothetical protein